MTVQQAEMARLVRERGPVEVIAPAGWVLKFNWRALLSAEDRAQAARIERSGSLDDWEDPIEDVYEK